MTIKQREKMEELLQINNQIDLWYGQYIKDTNAGEPELQQNSLQQLRRQLRALNNRMAILKELGAWS
jgi:hypothetical protein